MEIEFLQLTYNDKLIDTNFIIDSNRITGIITDYDTGIIDLLSLENRPSSGTIRLGNVMIKKGCRVNKKEISKKIGIIKYYTRNIYMNKTVKEEIESTINNYNIENVDKLTSWMFKIVGLSSDILDRNPNSLSATEKNKLSLALALSYNPDVLVFDNFELGLTYKERENFKRLLRVLKIKYNKTIILISNNVDFMKNIVDKYIVINNGYLVNCSESCYNDDMYDYTDMPFLINFIKYLRSEGHNIDEYVDIKELIKGIYRDIA
ncbi:MAG: ATP-binding cassette domain-containing protein [Bacilli bacterium]